MMTMRWLLGLLVVAGTLGLWSYSASQTPRSIPASASFFTPDPALEQASPFAACYTVPNCLGVNYKLAESDAAIERDLAAIAAAGFRVVRTDMFWRWIEYKPDQLDFTGFDKTITAMRRHNLRPMLILAYDNPFHPAVVTPQGRQAFTRYAAAAAHRYANIPVVWELWNEANTRHFWQPTPDPNAYMALANTVIATMRQNDPDVQVVGPAILHKTPPSNMQEHWPDADFLRPLFQQKFTQQFAGLSVHPYQEPPEHVIADYALYRRLLADAGVNGAAFPILNSEWGYKLEKNRLTEQQQADYAVRSVLVNYSQGVPFSIYYNWAQEDHSLLNAQGQPRPALHALQRLVKALAGYRFVRRLPSDERDFLLVFGKGQPGQETQWRLAAWTTRANGLTVPAGPNSRVALTGTPQYYDWSNANTPAKGRTPSSNASS